jgi:hypothetical protein
MRNVFTRENYLRTPLQMELTLATTRVVATLIALPLAKQLGLRSILWLVMLLILLDSIDCLWGLKLKCFIFAYHVRDKILDLAAYALALQLFGSLFDPTTRRLLWALLAYRAIGVLLFIRTRDVRYLSLFMDGVNVVMMLAWAASRIELVKANYQACFFIVLVAKAVFERYHYRNYKIEEGES